MWWALVGCFSDPLASIGLEPVKAEPPPPAPAPLEIPTTPPMDGEKITGEGSAPPPEAPAAGAGGGAPPAPPPAAFNPISIPQGPREEGGVKWEGVSKRGINASRTPNQLPVPEVPMP